MIPPPAPPVPPRLSVEAEGVRNPCLAAEDGRLLDGHNRRDIRPDAGIVFVPGSRGWSDDECRAFVYRLNRERRNLSPSQKADVRKKEIAVAKRLRKEDPRRYTQAVPAQMFGATRQAVSIWFDDERDETTADEGYENISIASACDAYIPPPDARVKIDPTHHELIFERLHGGDSPAVRSRG